jgi:hypothetical protein
LLFSDKRTYSDPVIDLKSAVMKASLAAPLAT